MLSSISQAKVICNVDSGDPKQDMVFDKLLITTEVSSPKYILIKAGNTSAVEVQLAQFDSLEKWQSINGASLVSLGEQQNGEFGITASTIDISKSSNILPLDALALGPIVEKQYLNLILPNKNLSIICFTQK